MKIIPAIDLKNGQCVRLYKGDFDQKTIYTQTPIEMAQHFEENGAKYLHIVDLDSAQSPDVSQIDIICDIAKHTGLEIQTGGGIRTKTHIQKLLDAGVKRVVIGSLAVKNPTLVQQWFEDFGADTIVLALDVNIQNGVPMIATDGWTQQSDTSLYDILGTYKTAQHILCTDIDKDGTLQGVNTVLYADILTKYPHMQLQASGGVSSLSDLQNLQQNNMPAVIIGKALYENKFTIKEALQC